MNISKRTQRLTKITLMTAFLIVASYVVIPVPFGVTGISLQTLAVNLIALLLSPGEAAGAIFVYILMCAIGVPVGNAGQGGIHYLAGPTGGFFLGFLLATILIAWGRGKEYSFRRYLFVTIGLGIPIIYVCAIGWMMIVTGMSLEAAFMTGCLPYLPMDVVKCVVAVGMSKSLKKGLRPIE